MPNRFPKATDVVLLVADDIRAEVNSKISLLGIAPSGRLFLPPESKNDPKLVVQLAIVILIMDGEGKFQGRFTIRDPEGGLVWEQSNDVIIIRHGSATFGIKLNAQTPKGGTYRVIIQLDKEIFERTFELLFEVPPKQ